MPSKLVAVLTVLTLAIAGCGDSTPNESGQGVEVNESESVKRYAAELLDVPTEQVDVVESDVLTSSSCTLYAARDLESTSPHPIHFAVTSDGESIAGQSDGIVETVLNSCLGTADAPTPDLIAEVVVRFADTSGPLIVSNPDYAERDLAKVDVEWHPPMTTDGSTVTFFAENIELARYVQVTVDRPTDGPLSINYTKI